MRFVEIKLSNYRNFGFESVFLGGGLNIILGKNGAGKTNFLESLYVTCRGHSFRQTESESLPNKSDPTASFVLARIAKGELLFDVKLTIANYRKQHILNGKKVPVSRLIKEFPILLFSPESLSVIKEGPQNRRELLDDSLLLHEPKHIKLLHDYQHLVKSRNQLLRSHAKGEQSLRETIMLLDSMEPAFLDLSLRLTNARLVMLRELREPLREASAFIFGKNVDISVDYLISGSNFFAEDAKKLAAFLKKRTSDIRSAELAAGITLSGPHKHDIKFLLDGNDSRYYSSQGQQRAIILSFRLAQAAYHNRIYGYYPVLMLDDVLSELDDDKRKHLIDFLHRVPSQVFVTTTDISLPEAFSSKDGILFEIEAGKVSKTRS